MIFFSAMSQREIWLKRLYPILKLLGKDGKGAKVGRVRMKAIRLTSKQRTSSTIAKYFLWREGKHSTRGSIMGESLLPS